MPWHVWGATLNTVHGEDDFSTWLSSDGRWGAVAVADGVSASSGGGASFLAAHGFTHACRMAPRGPGPGLLPALRRCFDYVSSVAADSIAADADVLEAVKKTYYQECSRDGKPCTRPLGLEDLLERRLTPPPGFHVERESPPSSTLLAALLGPDSLAFVIGGDGYILGASPLREETWLLWGAIPQLFEGSRLARFVEIGRGAAGRPLFFELSMVPGMVYVMSSDGVDAAALAEALTTLLQETPTLTRLGEDPAAKLLEMVREKTGGYEDDATIVVAAYYAS